MTEPVEARKLVIQIPCHDEAETLPIALEALPRRVEGFDVVEWLVVDDGSSDDTAGVARRHGVDHVVRLPRHQGLARAFAAGLEASLAAGASVIVNTDADNQYCAEDIPALVRPIVESRAQIVIGARPLAHVEDFSTTKRWLQRLGSGVVRLASGTEVLDATSGFRAIAREAAERLHVFAEYTYTIDMIVQAASKGMSIASVPIRTNPALRPSRLVKGVPSYVIRQLWALFRIMMIYRPLRFFSIPAAALVGLGGAINLRFLYFWFTAGGAGHLQSLILATILIASGTSLFVVALVADLIATNRRLLEQIDWRMRRLSERTRDPQDGRR